jgi:hypothetical protein
MKGIVMFDRAMMDHHIVGLKKGKDRFCMWFWLVSAASWKRRKVHVLGKEITLERGQLFVSIRTFADEMDVSKGIAERFIRDLKSGTMIETRNETGGTVITICNYEVYQDFNLYRETARETESKTRTGQQRDSNETATGHKRTPLTPLTPETPETRVSDTSVSSPISTEIGKAEKSISGMDFGYDLILDVKQAYEDYKSFAKHTKTPIPKGLNSTRKTAIQARLKECGGMDGFREVLTIAAKSPLLRGVNSGGSSWTITLDWLLKPVNFTKVTEGNYLERAPITAGSDRMSRLADMGPEPIARPTSATPQIGNPTHE